MNLQRQPLSNLQLEILKLYAHQIAENDLLQIKDLIGQYFAQKLTVLADNAWDKNNWSDDDMDAILNDTAQ